MFGQSRRAFLLSLAASTVSGAALSATSMDEKLKRSEARIAGLETQEACRLGVAALDTGSGARLLYRGDERFPMCSTFKAFAAAAVLKRVDEGHDTLDRKIAYGPADLLEYAPITKAHVADGAMTLGRPLRRCDRLERQHGGKPYSRRHRRAGRVDWVCPLARRRDEPPRPQRADAQHRHSRRPTRHHDAAGDGARPAEGGVRRCPRKAIARAVATLDEGRQGRRQTAARRPARLMGRSATRRAAATEERSEHDRFSRAAGARAADRDRSF